MNHFENRDLFFKKVADIEHRHLDILENNDNYFKADFPNSFHRHFIVNWEDGNIVFNAEIPLPHSIQEEIKAAYLEVFS